MKHPKPDFWKDYRQIIGKWPSILTLCISTFLYYRDGDTTIVKLAAFALLVFIVLYVVGYAICYYLYVREKKRELTNDMDKNQDYRVISVVHKRSDSNGKIRWVTTRTIESKVSELRFVRHRYSILGQGSKPKITSTTHQITYDIFPPDSKGWNTILIIFKKPLRKGEIAQFSMDVNGTNCKDLHFCRVNTPIGELVFDIELPDKHSAPHAELMMFRIDGDTVNVAERKEVVRFNRKKQCYYIKIDNPQVGYIYQLNWGKELKKSNVC